jgi:CheY-like chemotaxis protein
MAAISPYVHGTAGTALDHFPESKALLVDADPDTRLLYKAVLEPLGHLIIEAEDGAEALGKALSDRPALIVTETRLPRVDGFALCSMLRRDPDTRSIHIIVVTGAAAVADRIRALEAGADAVLVKPCEIAELVGTVGKVCAIPPSMIAERQPEPHTTSRRAIKSRTFQRLFTTTPPRSVPEAFCPTCAARLTYQHSHVGGVSEKHPEQWDYFTCASCGTYRYRHRTRKLTPVQELPRDGGRREQ